MQTVNYPIDKLIFAEYNPRQLTKDQYKNLKDSITRFGLVDPIIINTHKKRENIIIGGHQRVRIAQDLGMKDVPCVELKLTPEKERELNIRLNKNVGEWDWDALANCFDVGELTEWGFTEEDLQFFETEEITGLIDDDEVPEVEEAVTKSGDLWLLGEHRVLCGDATKKEDTEKLLQGTIPDMVFTDPPYGIGYEYNSHKDTEGDKYVKFCSNWYENIRRFPLIAMTTGWKYHAFWSQQDPFDVLYWYAPNKMTGGKASNLRNVEPIYIFGKIDTRLTNDWLHHNTNYGTDDKDVQHSCPKPIGLILWLLNLSNGKTVLDIFLGSGTTLIACEKTNRKCYGMEIDPHYCDVIVKRWEDYTGKKAERTEMASA